MTPTQAKRLQWRCVVGAHMLGGHVYPWEVHRLIKPVGPQMCTTKSMSLVSRFGFCTFDRDSKLFRLKPEGRLAAEIIRKHWRRAQGLGDLGYIPWEGYHPDAIPRNPLPQLHPPQG